MIAVLAGLVCLNPGQSACAKEDPSTLTMGLRAGIPIMDEDINQYDFFFARNLPWTKTLDSGWQIESAAELALHALYRSDEHGVSASFSTDLHVLPPESRIFGIVGVGVGALEDYVLGDYDFGGPIFFLFHAGAGLRLTEKISITCRYAHQSNGHIYTSNPSLNLSQIELRYSF